MYWPSRYLRRQKAIAEAAEESANAEASRLHLRTKTLETQVADLEAKLIEERRRNEVQLETSCQHANLMKQIEQVNLLNESNRLLRQERQTIRDAAVRAEEQVFFARSMYFVSHLSQECFICRFVVLAFKVAVI